jgi:hypothetical protein
MTSFWPFPDPQGRKVYTTRFVLEEGRPILAVSHDPDGEWEFLCATTDDPKDARQVSLAFILDLDSSLAEVGDLPVGWRALRDSADAPWIQSPFTSKELAEFRPR